jgi:hypothetical protein
MPLACATLAQVGIILTTGIEKILQSVVVLAPNESVKHQVRRYRRRHAISTSDTPMTRATPAAASGCWSGYWQVPDP